MPTAPDLDPAEAFVPGHPTDVEHNPPAIGPGHVDYVEPAADVEPLAGDTAP